MFENHLTIEQIKFLKPFFEATEDELNVYIEITDRAEFENECDRV